MYGSPARLRAEREAARRGNASAVISTILSLLVVAAAVAVVAYLVLRTPSSPVDSAERLDPVGTALPAPSEPPSIPTTVPTPESEPEPEPTALGFTGEAPAVAGLPTVAAPQEEAAPQEDAGPTPTPRLIAQPTEVPPTPLPAAPTLPPSVPVTQVPVVALQPVEAAPPPAPTSAPAQSENVSQPTPPPAEDDDDPFNIFDDENDSRIAPVDDPLERVRAMQEEQRDGQPGAEPTLAPGEERRRDDSVVIPSVEIPDIAMPTPDIPEVASAIEASRNNPNEVVMPDVDAMIDEITARATDPNRNPNVNDAGRRVTEDDEDDDDDDGDEDDRQSSSDKKRKSLRDRIKERTGRSDSSREDDSAVIPRPNVPGNGQQDGDDDSGPCMDPTAPGFPFDC